IAALLAGVATGEDEQLVSAWRAASARHEAFYQRLTSDGLAEEYLEAFRQEDSLAAWERVEGMLDRASTRKRFRWGRVAVAAAVAALVAVTWVFYAPLTSPGDADEERPEEVASLGRAQLILSDGSKITIDESNPSIIRDSAGTVIYQEAGSLDYSHNETSRDTTPIFNEIIQGSGAEYAMTLSDGTRVVLNAESKLRFPVKFTGKQRVIEFEGEAYFEVTHDAAHPFIVRAGGMEVTVLGTEFNLRAYKNEPSIATTLVEGSVQLSNGKELYRISPGEQGVYERETRAITKRPVDVSLYTAWYRHEIKFKDMPLDEVMRDLARWYGIAYEFLDEPAKQIKLGGCFERFESIDPILGMLRRTELVEVVVEHNKVYISTKK
ncbi:MAG: FecR domain-containing protein, partial [Odoribacteraceae bacterium]|nr:FecR domain-containing protein [Odoribacteraceae bacterium]